MPDVQILAPGTSAAPLDYTVPGLQEILVKACSASFNGAAAASSYVPTVQLVAPSGIIASSCPVNTTLAAGASADASWFPGISTTSTTPPVGQVRLVYDFTVTGAAKASINSASDGAFAGAFPTDLNYLEVFLTGRTDHAPGAPFVVPDGVSFTFNSDAGANYTRVAIASSVGGTPGQVQAVGQSSIDGVLAGSTAAANYSGLCRMFIPNYNGTTFFKITEFTAWAADNTAAPSHYQIGLEAAIWASATGLSSVQAFPTVGGAKFIIGTRMTIWAR